MVIESLLKIFQCVFVASLSSKISCLVHPCYDHYASPLFVFGDSILDVGNNNYINTTTINQANFWPYGLTYFHYSTGRFSDGRVISDFIVEHANLPLIHPFLQPGIRSQLPNGVNFASGGAGALVETFQGLVIDIHAQIKHFKEVEKWLRDDLGDAEVRRSLSRAVYLISIGGNDYLSLFFNTSTFDTTYPIAEYLSMVTGNITSSIKEIYTMGGRKFAFLNLTPLGCAPTIRIHNTEGDDCLKEASNYAILHNEAFSQAVSQLRKQLPGFKYSIFDFYTSFLQRLNSPSTYGFKDGVTACCGTGKYRGVFSCGGKRPVKEFELCKNIDDHIFWDSAHLTEKAYRQMADEMWSNTNSFGSHSIKDLFCLA